jgi:hypothetical protein
LFFLAYYFYYEKKPFSPVTVGFVGGLITSAILPIGFHEDLWVEPSPQQSTGRKFPFIPVEKTSLRWIGFDCGIVYALGIAAFLIRFGLIITV